MKTATGVLAAVVLLVGSCAGYGEELIPGGMQQQQVMLMGRPPFCDREDPERFTQTLTSTQDLRLGNGNRVLVTAPAGAVAPGQSVTVVLNVHSSSSLAFDVYVDGSNAYTFDQPLTIRVNTATCNDVPPNPILVKIGEAGQTTVPLSPQGNRIFVGTVRDLSLFFLGSPG